jgi:hypothetical protein
MKDAKQDNWEQIRARGHRQFIVRHGILRWGVPFGLAVTFGPAIYDLLAHSATPSAWTLAGSFAFCTLVFGYGMGETEWRKREKAYHAGHVG